MEIMKIRPIWTPFRFVQMHEQSSAPTPLVLLASEMRVSEFAMSSLAHNSLARVGFSGHLEMQSISGVPKIFDFRACRKTKLLFANTLKEYTLNLHPEFCFSCIKDICELTGKSRKEIEEMLKKNDIFELKLTEK